ncbi:MAG TPA: DUF4835 domain-containing protein [Marinilabiliales bacterium]|jgi:hypothetical protein|nr:MAG: hypothetical protein A2W95_06545 [Bacteroidetes bacterium GWA2_40_14]OFX58734.1 MAG: hypothetical protein A2W84_19420 [Bacteroidetes bacterium GWC2_40_13]OFX71872.1 MAG: hypothetical protein A2W96_06475 [Bacteroidetes bacterium GWD2_40_43]OFX94669.1 MAG: hypothetical protein A2W97_18280 [Bacteroidetes bacterium GWE2_40_63]OFY17971.1 MAG: hypothetical protein A2W88_16415 [Bacteroidetes bacterium GWF2_40_13]OFZ24435.1 MAG: hypothetical protein A2437_18415 [Bacteroidetes bacterium RIFOXYC
MLSWKFPFQFLVFFLLSLIVGTSYAQELNCRIQVNSTQIQGSNKTVFETMQKSLFEFLNNRNWTNHVYSTEERIECNFMLNITKQNSVDEFEGTLQVNSSRPVFNSGYSTPLFIYLDKKVKFRYAEGEAPDFSENTHNELTSLLAYYVYVVLAYDYDSFSLMGGTEYFQMAEKIVSTAQSSTSSGWKAFEDRKNRYWLIENNLNQIYAPVRVYYYNYHRLGLDVMHKNLADGRTKIAEGLNDLLKVHRAKQNSFIMQIFFEAKSEELIKILPESPPAEGTKAYNLLKEMDAANSAKYQKIIKKS